METLNNNNAQAPVKSFFSFVTALFSKKNNADCFEANENVSDREQRLVRHESRMRSTSPWTQSPWI
jgi:hypothetical protein